MPQAEGMTFCNSASHASIGTLQAAEERRLNLGVELYGYQQQLAEVNAGLEQNRTKVRELATRRETEEPISAKMRKEVEENAAGLEATRADVSLYGSCKARFVS